MSTSLSLYLHNGRYPAHNVRTLRIQNNELEWRHDHAVSTMSTLLKEFWRALPRTQNQQQAINRIRHTLRADTQLDQGAPQGIHWDAATTQQWFEDLDTIFFSGGLRDRCVVQAQNMYQWQNSRALGHTDATWNTATNQVDPTVDFETFEYDAGYPRKVHKRTRSTYILGHEMIHSMFIAYTCRCQSCSELLGESGHGAPWEDLAREMAVQFRRLFPELRLPSNRPEVSANPMNIGAHLVYEGGQNVQPCTLSCRTHIPKK